MKKKILMAMVMTGFISACGGGGGGSGGGGGGGGGGSFPNLSFDYASSTDPAFDAIVLDNNLYRSAYYFPQGTTCAAIDSAWNLVADATYHSTPVQGPGIFAAPGDTWNATWTSGRYTILLLKSVVDRSTGAYCCIEDLQMAMRDDAYEFNFATDNCAIK